ncbi:ABC transporter ATP-binding protein, partial [Pseudomonas soli]|nr:ABC transporter ATP-binding protein [Pseudomonas soli]
MRSVPPVHPEFMLEPIFDQVGSGREAIGLGRRREAGLDTRHGTGTRPEGTSGSFDGFEALNDLNLHIGAGELRCIIGP